MKPQVELAIWGFFMQRHDALHNVLFGVFSSGNEDERMNAERTARGPLGFPALIRIIVAPMPSASSEVGG